MPTSPHIKQQTEQPLVVEVAVPLPLFNSFYYLIPPDLASKTRPGIRLFVPFGRRKLTGYLLGFAQAEAGQKLKEVLAFLDTEPLWTDDELNFFRWIADYYQHPLGEVIKTALPSGINIKGRMEQGQELVSGGRKIRQERQYLLTEQQPEKALRGKTAEIYSFMQGEQTAFASELRGRFGACSANLRRLQELGLLGCRQQEVYRNPFSNMPVEQDQPRELNPHQQQALDVISKALQAGCFSPFLLHGVTGSGKTEVYLQAIDYVIKAGKNALVLVPEIALTPQLVYRFRARFQVGLAVLHSGLSDGERFDEWRRIRRNEVRIVIGARSAIFAPLDKIGIIVVDEEHEGSYKQSDGLRYNGRDLALVRGKQSKAVVLLGSATPLVSTRYAVEQGRLGYLQLPYRVAGRPMPEASLLNVKLTSDSLFAPQLLEALEQNLSQGEQSLLFLNRRGYASWLVCPGCGTDLQCPNCSVSLTFHRQQSRSICHYCDYHVPSPCICPNCGELELKEMGVGTERVEHELKQYFPDARIARMDSDTVSGKGGHERVLDLVRRHDVDILVGTQMIAKGHDFPGVTLVGVLQAEGSLYQPDFRAAERTFQLLSQVIGRAGRGELPGRVLLQSGQPDNYAIKMALEHDYDRFYQEELLFRQELGYPPFGHLAAIQLSALTETVLETAADQAATELRKLKAQAGLRVEILGPAAAPLYRLRGRFRQQILLKSGQRGDLHRLLQLYRKGRVAIPAVRETVDIDPVDLF